MASEGLGDLRVPLWVQENVGLAASDDFVAHWVLTGCAEDMAERRPDRTRGDMARTVYLLDGPTFPISDGGSAAKSALLAHLRSADPTLLGIAARWPHDDLAAYRAVGQRVLWVPVHEYYDRAVADLMEWSGATTAITDSLETATRLRDTRVPRILVFLMDYYPELWEERGVAKERVEWGADALDALAADSRVVFIARTKEDAARLVQENRARSVELFPGIDVGGARPAELHVDGPAAVLGNFFYPPNADGLRVLADSWGEGPRLRVIGRIPAGLRQDIGARLGSRVEFTGRVPELANALRGTCLGLVPLITGGGSSVKVLDYCARKVPTVSTLVGARGLPAQLVGELTLTESVPEMGEAVRHARRTYDEALIRADRARRITLDLCQQIPSVLEVVADA